MDPTLNRLLSALEVAPHAFSVCRIQSGWRMSFPVFKAVTVHFVLRGSGHIQAGGRAPVPFFPSSVLVVPALQPHWVGDVDTSASTGAAADKCELIGDGLVEFTAGDGTDDTLLLCAALSAPDQAALGLFDLMRWPVADDLAASGVPAAIVDAMRHEVTNAGLGTQAMCQALMKQALITLLRRNWSQADGSGVLDALHHPRLARAVAAIIEQPGADHTVGSLAGLAGMSRASFSDHFLTHVRPRPDRFRAESALAGGGATTQGHRPADQGSGSKRGLCRIAPVLSRVRSDLCHVAIGLPSGAAALADGS